MYIYIRSIFGSPQKIIFAGCGYCPCFSPKTEGLNYPFQSVGDVWWLLRMDDTITIQI